MVYYKQVLKHLALGLGLIQKRVLAFENGVLAFEKVVLAFEN
jgi:hypothetical protein